MTNVNIDNHYLELMRHKMGRENQLAEIDHGMRLSWTGFKNISHRLRNKKSVYLAYYYIWHETVIQILRSRWKLDYTESAMKYSMSAPTEQKSAVLLIEKQHGYGSEKRVKQVKTMNG